MHIFMFVFVALLFYVLTPGVMLTLPPKGSKMVVAMTHAVVFALVWTLIHKSVWEWGIATGWIQGGNKRNSPVNSANYVENMTEGARGRKHRGGAHPPRAHAPTK